MLSLFSLGYQVPYCITQAARPFIKASVDIGGMVSKKKGTWDPKSQNTMRAIAVLEYCQAGFKSITALIDTVAPRSSLYRFVALLLRDGLLESNGREEYRTTAAGLALLAKTKGGAPEGLVHFYPPLAQVPTAQHRAVIELVIAAMIARKFELRVDRHPSLILSGGTLKWKTSTAKFLCHMFRLDPDKNIVNLAVESGQSLWVRKNSKGKITYQRDLLKEPLLTLDEFQAADTHTKRLAGIFIDGKKRVNLENEQMVIEPVAIIILNPRQGNSLESSLGLETAQIRRCLPCNLDNVKVPNLALAGEVPLSSAKEAGPFVLRKPTADCEFLRARAYGLMQNCLSEEGSKLVDLETLLMLSSALTGYLNPEEALKVVFFDAMLLFETLEWTRPGWMRYFSDTSLPDESNQPNIPDREDDAINTEILISGFKLLEKGYTATDLLTKKIIPANLVERVVKKYADFKALDALSRDLREKEESKDPRLARKALAAEQRRIKAERDGLIKLRSAVRRIEEKLELWGVSLDQPWKEKSCVNNKKGYCHGFYWDVKPTSELAKGMEFLQIGKRYHAKTSPSLCGPCTGYERK